jgi:hypothetical protein
MWQYSSDLSGLTGRRSSSKEVLPGQSSSVSDAEFSSWLITAAQSACPAVVT